MTKKSIRNTRGKIVNAAWRLSYEQGYEDTTVGEIIELPHTFKGFLYYYSDGKDTLLSALSLLFDEKYEGLMEISDIRPQMSAMGRFLFLNSGLFGMIENSIPTDLLTHLLSTQLTTNDEKHLLNHNRTCYKSLRKIIAQGQDNGQLNVGSSVNEVVELYALLERAFSHDWCLCQGEYSLRGYSVSVMPASSSSSLPSQEV